MKTCPECLRLVPDLHFNENLNRCWKCPGRKSELNGKGGLYSHGRNGVKWDKKSQWNNADIYFKYLKEGIK